MSILKIENLGFSYDDEKQVLKDIDMEFELGKTYGIFGKSGAGKTTLLSLIAGLEKIQKGDILINNKSIKDTNKDEYRSKQIGVIFQSYNLLPQLTALENVVLSLDISGSKDKEKTKKEKALKLLKKVGLDENKASRKVLQLSGGEQQRVSIARSISYDANIILADEPTGNLDHDTEEDIINLLKNLAHKENKCVIVISHSKEVRDNMDIVYHLKNGKLNNEDLS